MGIESDRLVYDYLSRVGDLAHQQQLSSGTRMKLVSTLRGEIDRQRQNQSADTPASVRRILGRLGTPDELVAAAAESGGAPVEPPRQPERGAEKERAVPGPREARRGMLRRDGSGRGTSWPGMRKGTGPGTRTGADAEASGGAPTFREEPETPTGPGHARVPENHPEVPEGTENTGSPGSSGNAEAPGEPVGDAAPPLMPGGAPSPPHMAGTDELGPSGDEADWWHVDPGPFGAGVDVPGFSGGIEIPAMMRKPSAEGTVPRPRTAADGDPDGDEDDLAAEETAGSEEPAPRRRRLLGLLRRAPREAGSEGAGRRGFSHPVLLFAAVLLVVGAVLGSWLALAAGWLLAYSSRTLSRAEAKWAAMGLPGVVVAGAVVWLWGRMEGRWGEPIARDGLGEAMTGMWPVVVRMAAVASAVFLVWRARRRAE